MRTPEEFAIECIGGNRPSTPTTTVLVAIVTDALTKRDADHATERERLEAEHEAETVRASEDFDEEVTRLEARIQALRDGLGKCKNSIESDSSPGNVISIVDRALVADDAADDVARKGT